MKIHHVVPHFYPEKGGVETSVLGLSRHLVRMGHEVVVHTSRRSLQGNVLPAAGTLDGIRIRRYRPGIRLGYYTTLFHPELAGTDVLHLHGYGFVTNDRAARSVRGSIPILYSLHHGVAQPPPSVGAGIKRAIYDPVFGLKTLARASAIVPASEADRPWLESRGFPSNRIHTLPTGLDPEAFRLGSPERAKERFGLHEYVVFLGRLHREKSPDHLLLAVADLDTVWKGSAVFVGSDGGYRSALERLAGNLGLRDRILFTGEVDEATKRDILAGAACVVLPSFYEAQGIAILEAWAQARPVVASRVGGVPYTVHDGEDGLLYNWGDIPALAGHMRRILEDPRAGSILGQSGLKRALSEYTWDRVAPRFGRLYEIVTT